MKKYHWVGPFQITKILNDVITQDLPRPPDKGGAYLVTKRAWTEYPSIKSVPLYVGGNSGNSARFRTRVGDLIADTFGFYGGGTGHHSGGQHLYEWCQMENFNPLKLWIGWIDSCSCHRCLENEIFSELNPSLNRMRPTRCPLHL